MVSRVLELTGSLVRVTIYLVNLKNSGNSTYRVRKMLQN